MNVGIDLFRHPEQSTSPPYDFNPTVRLLRALNNGFLGMVGVADQKLRLSGSNGLAWPRWVVNNVGVPLPARDPANRYFFAVSVDGMETHSTIWAHGADSRTIFPQIDVPSRSGDGCS